MWVAFLAVTSALAADPLQACCQATGASLCPAELAAVGPGSNQVVGPSGTTVTGVWVFACTTGASFQGDGMISVERPFPPGTVISPIVPQAVACFDAACRLPEGLCLHYDGKRVKTVACADKTDATDALWRAAPRAPRGAVVIGGRVLGTDPPPETAPPPGPIAAPAPTAPLVAVDPTVPPPPPSPCQPAAALRQPSNDQVDQGNEAIIKGDPATAMDRYRAAITINKCNAFAWAALGDSLLQTGYTAPARTALEHATALMPSNVHAWTVLGKAREKSGDRPGAALAYQTALEKRPGYAPAAEGLARVQ